MRPMTRPGGYSLGTLSGQSGYSAVEMIITMALTTIVLGAISGVFFTLYKVQSAWQSRAQASSEGIIAEQAVVRDARIFAFVPDPSGSPVFTAISSIGTRAPGLFVTYCIPDGRTLTRVVTAARLTNAECAVQPADSSRRIAHGVTRLTVTCLPDGMLDIAVTVQGLGADSPAATTEPDTRLAPRGGGC